MIAALTLSAYILIAQPMDQPAESISHALPIESALRPQSPIKQSLGEALALAANDAVDSLGLSDPTREWSCHFAPDVLGAYDLSGENGAPAVGFRHEMVVTDPQTPANGTLFRLHVRCYANSTPIAYEVPRLKPPLSNRTDPVPLIEIAGRSAEDGTRTWYRDCREVSPPRGPVVEMTMIRGDIVGQLLAVAYPYSQSDEISPWYRGDDEILLVMEDLLRRTLDAAEARIGDDPTAFFEALAREHAAQEGTPTDAPRTDP